MTANIVSTSITTTIYNTTLLNYYLIILFIDQSILNYASNKINVAKRNEREEKFSIIVTYLSLNSLMIKLEIDI